jgi:radical SAM superfamily enzyme YgiQ (UPF0313 family)
VKILFVNPPYVGWLNDIKVEPIGLLYIASFVRQQGHQVALHDPYIGDSEAAFVDRMLAWRPDAVAIAVYTVSEAFCFGIARLAKSLDPRVLVIVGGPHASFTAPRMFGRCPAIDVVTHRESEESVAAVLAARGAGRDLATVAGISWRDPSGKIVTTPYFPLRTPLDRLPIPARDLLSDAYYEKYGAAGVITARGCAYKCDFCVSPAFFKGVRQRDLGLVAGEIRMVMAERGVRHVRFYDDVFAYNEKKLDSIRYHIGPLGVTFDCYIRVDATTPRMLKLLRESGCIQIRFGVETGNEVLRSLRKGGRTVSFEKHREVVDTCLALGIESQASYIFGFPDETLSDMEATIEFADRLDTDQVGFYKLTPYPGTIYWEMIDPDEISLEDYCKFDNEASVNLHVSSDEIIRLLERAYVRYYSKRAIPFDRPDTLRFLTSLPKLRY